MMLMFSRLVPKILATFSCVKPRFLNLKTSIWREVRFVRVFSLLGHAFLRKEDVCSKAKFSVTSVLQLAEMESELHFLEISFAPFLQNIFGLFVWWRWIVLCWGLGCKRHV